MKQVNLAVMFVAVIGAGLIGVSSGSMMNVSDTTDSTTYGERTGMLGHVTAVQKDANGNIISYSQSDNTVVTQGKDCLAFLTFGSINKTSSCGGTDGFNQIYLYANTQDPDDAGDTYSGTTFISGNGLTDCDLSTANDGSTSGTYEDRYNGITSDGKAFLKCTFTASADSLQVQGAAIANNGTTNTMFAAQNFTGNSGLTLNTNDKLTVTWDITFS